MNNPNCALYKSKILTRTQPLFNCLLLSCLLSCAEFQSLNRAQPIFNRLTRRYRCAYNLVSIAHSRPAPLQPSYSSIQTRKVTRFNRSLAPSPSSTQVHTTAVSDPNLFQSLTRAQPLFNG